MSGDRPIIRSPIFLKVGVCLNGLIRQLQLPNLQKLTLNYVRTNSKLESGMDSQRQEPIPDL